MIRFGSHVSHGHLQVSLVDYCSCALRFYNYKEWKKDQKPRSHLDWRGCYYSSANVSENIFDLEFIEWVKLAYAIEMIHHAFCLAGLGGKWVMHEEGHVIFLEAFWFQWKLNFRYLQMTNFSLYITKTQHWNKIIYSICLYKL